MTAYDLWFVVRSIDRSHGIIGVRGAQRSAHEEDARRPVASPGGRQQQQQQQQQRCRSRLYKSFQDATDRSFMHLLPVLFETPPPSAGNVRSATTPRSHVDPRLQKKKETKKKETTTTTKNQTKKQKQRNKQKTQKTRSSTQHFWRISVQPCHPSACEDFNARSLSKKSPKARRRMLQSAGSAAVRELLHMELWVWEKKRKGKEREGFSLSSPRK